MCKCHVLCVSNYESSLTLLVLFLDMSDCITWWIILLSI
jgi:hypothetical protein